MAASAATGTHARSGASPRRVVSPQRPMPRRPTASMQAGVRPAVRPRRRRKVLLPRHPATAAVAIADATVETAATAAMAGAAVATIGVDGIVAAATSSEVSAEIADRSTVNRAAIAACIHLAPNRQVPPVARQAVTAAKSSVVAAIVVATTVVVVTAVDGTSVGAIAEAVTAVRVTNSGARADRPRRPQRPSTRSRRRASSPSGARRRSTTNPMPRRRLPASRGAPTMMDRLQP